MKKILSFLLLGMLCSIGNLWAANPDVAITAMTDATAATYFKSYGDVTLLQTGTYQKNKETYYYAVLDQTNNSAYIGVTASSVIDSVSFLITGNGNNKQINAGLVGYQTVSATPDFTNADFATNYPRTPQIPTSLYADAFWATFDLTGEDLKAVYLAKQWKNVVVGTASKASFPSGNAQSSFVYGVKVWLKVTSAPTIATDLVSTATATVGIAKEFSIVASGAVSYQWYTCDDADKTNPVEISGATAASYSYTAATPGTVYIYCVATNTIGSTASTVCAVTASNPPAVASATIAGPAAGYVGDQLTYTATADNATTFAWFVDGVAQAETSATFVYTAVKGSHAIKCTATNDFTATPVESNEINVNVTSLYGTLVSFVVNGGNAAKDVAGVLSANATNTVNLATSKPISLTIDEVEYTGYKMGGNGQVVGTKLTSGNFVAGDTVSFMVTNGSSMSGSTALHLYDDANGTTEIATLSESSTGWMSFVLTSSTQGVYLYRKSDNQNPYVAAMKVVRPKPEKSRSAATLSNAKINDEDLAAADLATLKSSHSFASSESFVEAPEVKFISSVTITYEDDSQKVLEEITTVTATENAGVWSASATINEVTYTITAVKPSTATVTYKYGETVLGTENVEVGGSPADYVSYQTLQLATFGGWYSDGDLADEHLIADIAAEEVNADITYYAKFMLQFAQSVNIEQLVLDNGKSYGIIAQLGTLKYSSNITGSLDSLDVKDDGKRNYSYLGLKVKQSGALLNFRVAKDNSVIVKFGNIAETPNVSINGGAYAEMTITNGVYSYEATEDALISIKMMDKNAVVFKQIQIGAAPAFEEVALPVKLGANGWLTFAADYKFTVTGATVYEAAVNANKTAVILTEVENAVVPASTGIILKGTAGELAYIHESSATASDFSANALVGAVAEVAKNNHANAYVLSTNDNVTEFNPCDDGIDIPANKAYLVIEGASTGAPIRIEFAENNATDIQAVEANDEVVKFMENGQLFIRKNGVVYTTTGQVVR